MGKVNIAIIILWFGRRLPFIGRVHFERAERNAFLMRERLCLGQLCSHRPARDAHRRLFTAEQ